MRLSLLLHLLALVTPTLAIPSHHIPDKLAQIKRSKLTTISGGSEADSSKKKAHLTQSAESDVQTLYFTQQLNHFDPSSTSTFQQRYFYTDRFVHSPNTNGHNNLESNNRDGETTAAFLCIGGEGPSLDTSALINSIHCTGDMIELANRLYQEGWSVHLFALEHRYYGDSFPVDSDSQESSEDESAEDESSESEEEEPFPNYSDLTYLSSRQAVRDVITFIQSPQILSAHYLSTKDDNDGVQWITFGGSYPGMLSTWSRLLHPSIIHGAVGNSAPVQAELDFPQYYNHAGRDLGHEEIGGGEECRRIFVDGHEEIVDLLEGNASIPDGGDAIEYIAQLFNVCGGADALGDSQRNVEILIGDGVIRVPSQENDPSCEKELCNIEKLCNAIITESKSNPEKSPMHILATINNLKNGDECSDADWQDYIDYYSNPNPMNANDRSWLYQTCTEFGFYQTCNSDSDCPYAKGYHEVDRDLELCQKVFGISPEDVRTSIQSTLEYYGGWNLTPSAEAMEGAVPASGPRNLLINGGINADTNDQRILFVNGDVDPWSELAVSEQRGVSNDDEVISVPGASHHFWTHKIKESDGDAIVDAREQIYNVVSSWLGAAAASSITEVE
ncbi:hypothetical protein ACHAXN_005317 [Cyclotella atomus]